MIMDTKIPVKTIANSILYFVLLLVALLLLIGPIREILRDETVFTESYQKIKGKVIDYCLHNSSKILTSFSKDELKS